ncbi:CoA-binding protein [Chloroflexota bacterium]
MKVEEEILKSSRTVAIVGLSANTERPSYIVASYLKDNGYRIIPVNPREKEILGENCYPDLLSISEKVDVVDIFRRSEEVLPIVRQAINIGASAVWMQEGVMNEEAAKQAREAGLKVVMDRCMRKEHLRLQSHESDPAPFLVDNIELLPKGRVLDVAMGNGRNAIYLAGRGFDVEGVDISSEAVNAALESARKAGVTIRAQAVDLEAHYSIEKDTYDVIICFNYLQRSLIPQVRDGLRNGGMVVYETFIVDQARFGKPRNPAYLLKHNELLNMFRDFRCLRYYEGIVPGPKAIAGIIAEKVAQI